MNAARFLAGVLAVGAMAWPALGQYDSPLPKLPAAPPAAETAPTPTTVLTAPPGTTTTTTVYPSGTVFSPACPDGSCCGPVGAHGPLTYELYFRTGPSLVVGGSELSGRLNTGWQVGGGARTLYFNPTRDAAWVLTTGISYTYNRGRQERGGPLLVHTTLQTGVPDVLTSQLVRGLHRTSFDFGFGRDWWVNGPGNVGGESAWNCRSGFEVGGRWGTSHVDAFRPDVEGGYHRKQSVFHSVLVASHTNWERPMGNWILFAGVRGEFEYSFLNVVPPNGSDIVGINFLMNFGVRY